MTAIAHHGALKRSRRVCVPKSLRAGAQSADASRSPLRGRAAVADAFSVVLCDAATVCGASSPCLMRRRRAARFVPATAARARSERGRSPRRFRAGAGVMRAASRSVCPRAVLRPPSLRSMRGAITVSAAVAAFADSAVVFVAWSPSSDAREQAFGGDFAELFAGVERVRFVGLA